MFVNYLFIYLFIYFIIAVILVAIFFAVNAIIIETYVIIVFILLSIY